MSRRTARADALTGDLFFTIPQPAAQLAKGMDYRVQVSQLTGDMLEAAHAAGLDRFEVAAQASRLTGKDVSKAMLDGYTAVSREDFNVPLWLGPVLESVCSSTVLAEWHASICGGRLLVGAENLDAEIGRLERQREAASDRIKLLKAQSRRVR